MKKLLVVAALLMPFGASIAAPVSAVPGAPTNYRYFDRLPSASGSIRPPGTDESIPLGSSGCGSRTVSWTVGGNTCTGSTGTTSGNTVKAVTSTNANSGIGNFRCDGTTFDYTYQAAGSTCAPPPPSNCTAQTLSWTIAGNTCTGAASTTANSATVSVASTSANSGTGSFTCNSATNTYTNNAASSTCNPTPPASCTNKPLNWTVGGVTCGAQSGVTANATNKTISSTNGQNGSATFTCNSSTDTYTQGAGATCSAPACSSQSLSWTVGGLTCSGTSASTANTGTATVNNTTAGRTGSATFTCNGSTNAYTGPAPGASCAAAATACTDKTVSWTQGSNTCSAPSGTTNNGTTKTVTTTTASRLGSASITCNASTDTYTVAAGGTCYPTTCTSQTLNWTSGSNTCSGTTGTVNNGASASVTSTSANTGSVTATCNSQTNTYAQSGATCNAPPVNCVSQAVTWSVSGNTCSGTASATTHNNAVAVSSANGSASFTCSNGSFTGPAAGATCTAPPPTNCASQTLTWTQGVNTCSASSGARNASTTFTLASTNGLSGSASFTCTNGTYSAPSSATCTAPNFNELMVTFSPSLDSTRFAGPDGRVYFSGVNSAGNKGNGTMPQRLGPELVASTEQFTKIAAFDSESYFLTTDGRLFVSGLNPYSSFNNKPSVVDAPVFSGISGIRDVSTNGSRTTCIVSTAGALSCRGSNFIYTLGDGTTTTSTSFMPVPGHQSGVTEVTVSSQNVCFIKNGGAWCWGGGSSGANGDTTTTNRTTPVQVSGITSGASNITNSFGNACVIHNGAAKCWGDSGLNGVVDPIGPQPTPKVVISSGVTSITSIGNGYCVVHNGAAKCWGARTTLGGADPGQQGSQTPVNVTGLGSGVTQVLGSNAANSVCAIHNGTAKCWGTTSDFPDSIIFNNGTGALPPSMYIREGGAPATVMNGASRLIGTGTAFCAVSSSTNMTSCWHNRGIGAKANDRDLDRSLVAISYPEPIASFPRDLFGGPTYALSRTGALYGTGTNYVFIPNLTDNTSVLGGNNSARRILTPIRISVPGVVVQAVSRDYGACALNSIGDVYCWGVGNQGQLGNGTAPTTTVAKTPVKASISGVRQIINSNFTTCALTNSGAVQCWGDGALGLLGNGSLTDSSTPVNVSGLTSGVKDIFRSGGTIQAFCATLDAGGVRCWGNSKGGRLGNGAAPTANTYVSTPVAMSNVSETVRKIHMTSGLSSSGGVNGILLTENGTIKTWGDTLGNGSSTSSATPVNLSSLGNDNIDVMGRCALKANGQVWCWGQFPGNGSATSLSPVQVSGLPAANRIWYGDSGHCARAQANGRMYCWGDDVFGGLALGDAQAQPALVATPIVGQP